MHHGAGRGCFGDLTFPQPSQDKGGIMGQEGTEPKACAGCAHLRVTCPTLEEVRGLQSFR